MLSVRLDEALLRAVDRERRRARKSRAEVAREAFALWIERRRVAEAVERHRAGYARIPVTVDEFGPLLGAQVWPA
jgi:metal-responsive CopG/Arc/MetJ family transcriptional regulator